MQPRSTTHWPSFWMLLFCSMGMLVLFSGAAIFTLVGLSQLISQDFAGNPRGLLLATGAVLSGLLLLPAAYYSLRRLAGKAIPPPAERLPPLWPLIFLLMPWPAAIFAGQWLIDNSSLAWLLTPPLYVLAVGLPILALAGIGLNGLPLGSGQRVWSILNLGLVLGPGLIMVAEIVLFIVLLFLLVIGLTLFPEAANSLASLMLKLQYAATEQAAIRLLLPHLLKPAVILPMLGVVSVLIPLIEEPLKTIGVWFFWKQPLSPAEGFALGILSGAGYALFESLGMGSNTDSGWGTLMLARFGTDLVHILNGGLMGWALVRAWREKRFLQLGMTYVLAVLIHGLWNTASIFFSISHLISILPDPPTSLQNLGMISALGLIVLICLMLAVLWLVNRKLRAASRPTQPLPVPPATMQTDV